MFIECLYLQIEWFSSTHTILYSNSNRIIILNVFPMSQKLSKCQAKLVQALKTEILNHETGIAVDQDGNSLGVVDVSTHLFFFL